MKFDITNIKRGSGDSMEVRYQGPLPQGDLIDMITVKDDLVLEGTLTHYDGMIFLNGTVKLSYEGRCARCLKPVKRSLNLKLQEKFSTVETEDDEVYSYEGNYVDLTKAVMDNIIIALPIRLLCTDQCKGLCPVCGKNRNNETCSCKESDEELPKENKFGILKNYFSN